MLKYQIRPAELNDLARCLEIDASYITTHVWQMQERFEQPGDLEEDNANRSRQKILGKPGLSTTPAFQIEFNPSRLPRPLAIANPLNDQQLLTEWKKTDHLLIAESLPANSSGLPEETEASEALPLLASDPAIRPDILGYMGLAVDSSRHVAWITTGAVQIDYRRQGVGTRLLNEARAWADRYRLRSIMVELQTKNYPAINFYQKKGFFFCGYNNAYYSDREIAIFFGKRLEKFN